MKSINKIFLLILVPGFFYIKNANSQAFNRILTSQGSTDNFINLSRKIDDFYDTAQGSNKSGYKQWKRFEWFASNHLNENGNFDNYLQKNATALKAVNQLKISKALAVNSSTGNWINIGHTASVGGVKAQQGRVNTIAFDPVNANIVYAGAAGGGIWKSINGGTSWANLTIDLPILGISDIAVAPAPNNNIVYALSGEGLPFANVYYHKGIGIIKSTDGGINWQTTGTISTLAMQVGGNKLLIHPTNPNIILAAMSNGLWRTMDGGNVWINISIGDVNDIEFKPNDPNTLYMTFRNSGNLGILNLTSLNLTSIGIIAPPTPPINAPNVNRMEIAVTAANPKAVYVLAGPGYVSGGVNLFYGLYYSNNSGATFTQRSNQCTNNGDLFNSASEFAWYANTIYVNPLSENNVIIGGLNLFTSTDGGTTLNEFADPALHSDQHNLKRNPVNGDLWLCNDGGVYKSTNNGGNWNNSSTGLIINEYYRISGAQSMDDNLIGGVQDNGHFTRVVGTNNFISSLGSDGMDNYFNSYDNNNVYACAQNGKLYRSVNAGFAFLITILPNAGKSAFFPWITPIVQHPPTFFPANNTDVIYAYSLNGIMKGTGGATTWVNMGPLGIGVASGALTPCMAIGSDDFGASANLYISNGNNFWVHTDPLSANPAGWINRPLPITATSNTSAIAVNPANKNEVWITISGYNATQKVYRSTNAGISWTNMTLSLPNTPVYSIAFANNNNNPGGAVYVGTEIGVYFTDDNYADWIPFSNQLPHVPVTDLQINYINNTLKAATYGRGIWQSDLFQNCRPTFTLNYDINQGQFNFETSNTIFANAAINGQLGTRVTLKAGSRITLQAPDFKASAGTYFRAVIGDCGSGVLSKTDSTGIKK